jgi:small subunit ribosomal protein S16
MLKIRLKRVGRRNHPSFRVVVTESTKGPKSGKVVDTLGFYEPMAGKKEIDGEKAGKWISNGAQPSGTVHNMLVDMGVVKGKKINVLPKKSPIVKEEEEKHEEPKAESSVKEDPAPEEAGAVEEKETETPAEETASETESPSEEPKQEEESKPDEEPAEKSEEADAEEKSE